MFKCENADECQIDCPHKIEHEFCAEPENDCDAACDVEGVISGSLCKQA